MNPLSNLEKLSDYLLRRSDGSHSSLLAPDLSGFVHLKTYNDDLPSSIGLTPSVKDGSGLRRFID